jgi:PEGA domain
MRAGWWLCLPFLFFSSCATITRGVHEKLKVESDPSGANVALSTGEKGVTPATFVELRRHDPFTVTVSKPGYASQTVNVTSHVGGTGGTAMAGNIILGGAIGMGVDAGTGAYDSLYPNPVKVTLVPTSKSKTSKKTTSSSEKPRAKPNSTPTR